MIRPIPTRRRVMPRAATIVAIFVLAFLAGWAMR